MEIIIIIIIIIFYPGTHFPGNEKNTLCNPTMYKNQAGMNLTPPPPSQNSHAVRWHCIAESKRRVAEIKSRFLCRRPTDQQACDRVLERKTRPYALTGPNDLTATSWKNVIINIPVARRRTTVIITIISTTTL